MIELITLDSSIMLDVRYARDDNFIGRPVYPSARVFLQPVAANAVANVHRDLAENGLGLVIFDGYRPWSITKLFWEVVLPEHRQFVADPERGSKHNRGCAVDLSLFDRTTGDFLPMPSGYDEFTERASPDYPGGTDDERRNRDLLRSRMEAAGFTVNPREWWHFDHIDWESYPIADLSFEEAAGLAAPK
ncbi:MAG TPA: M15 family metallopeptidase [Pyrinomonadaceae bacterium]|nr:M15 family metallopeptidase [Pyrinomonadaceae bacterium]